MLEEIKRKVELGQALTEEEIVHLEAMTYEGTNDDTGAMGVCPCCGYSIGCECEEFTP